MANHAGSYPTLQCRLITGCMSNTRAGGVRALAIKRLLKSAGIEPPNNPVELEKVSVDFIKARTNRRNIQRLLDWMLTVKSEPQAEVPKFVGRRKSAA